MVEWIKYDKDNPPTVGKRYLVIVFNDREFIYSMTYEEWGWSTNGELSEGAERYLHYVDIKEINLPIL